MFHLFVLVAVVLCMGMLLAVATEMCNVDTRQYDQATKFRVEDVQPPMGQD